MNRWSQADAQHRFSEPPREYEDLYSTDDDPRPPPPPRPKSTVDLRIVNGRNRRPAPRRPETFDPRLLRVRNELKQRVLDAKSRYTDYTTVLSETQDASTALASSRDNVKSLGLVIEMSDSEIKDLEPKLLKKRAVVEKIRGRQGSKVRRLTRTFGSSTSLKKFEEQAQNDEQELKDMTEQLSVLETRRGIALGELHDEQTVIANLQDTLGKRDLTKVKLGFLFDSIFDGPTPAFPVEDEAEKRMKDARNHYDNAIQNVNVMDQVIRLLDRSIVSIDRARSYADFAWTCHDAHDVPHYQAKTASVEQLNKTQQQLAHAEELRDNAAKMAAKVGHHPQVRVPPLDEFNDSVMAHMLSTNWKDYNALVDSMERLWGARVSVGRVLENEKKRSKAWQEAVEISKMRFEEEKEGLHELRRRIFEKVLLSPTATELPNEEHEIGPIAELPGLVAVPELSEQGVVPELPENKLSFELPGTFGAYELPQHHGVSEMP